MSGGGVEVAPSPEQVLAIRRPLHRRSPRVVSAGDAASPGAEASFATAGLAAKVLKTEAKQASALTRRCRPSLL